MYRIFSLTVIFLILSLNTGFSAEFKEYPGAVIDEEATKEAQEFAAMAKEDIGMTTIYTTKDPFDRVAAFYKKLGKEISMPHSSGTSGKPKKYEGYDLWEAYFTLDGAQGITESKCWVKVQRPFIGEEVIDITAITLMKKE
jgi:hypothetical protein